MISVSVWFLLLLADSIITGNLIGAEAISGIAVVIPFISSASFISAMISCGAEILVSRYIGAFDKKRAAGIAGMAAICAIVSGALMALVMYFIRDVYFDWTGISGAVRLQAAAYWKWQVAVVGAMPLCYLVEHLVYADGDETASEAGSVVNIVLNIALSVFLVKKLGTAEGAALGSLVATIADISVESVHFFRKSNSISFRCYFNIKDFFEMLGLSLTDSIVYICWGATLAVLNTFVVGRFGEDCLPVVALAFEALEISVVFDGLGEAFKPVAGMYCGERNYSALRKIVSGYFKMSLFTGLAAFALILVCAPFIPRMFDISDPGIYSHCVRMIAIMSFAMPFMSVLLMMTSQYLVMRRIALPVGVTIFKDFIAITLFPVLFGLAGGIDWMWVGFPAGMAVVTVGVLVWIRLRYADGWPWLLPPDDGRIFNLSFTVNKETVISARDEIEKFMRTQGASEAQIVKAMLIVEETLMLVLDRNHFKKVVAETTVINKGTGFTLVTRDTGDIMDLTTGEDVAGDFRGFFVASLMKSQDDKTYLPAVNCNRTEYSI